jgi:hypothetical protein
MARREDKGSLAIMEAEQTKYELQNIQQGQDSRIESKVSSPRLAASMAPAT